MYRGKIIALGAPAELKRDLSTHKLLRLDTSAPLDTMRAVEQLPGVLDVAVFGSGLHVVVDEIDASKDRIQRALAQNGIEIRVLEQISPSLEDVFVGLIEAEERKAA
jgi:ABC-2 type transport system ATP-binding protein